MENDCQANAGHSVRTHARRRGAYALLALIACTPLQAHASSYDLVLTWMIAIPMLVVGVCIMAVLLLLRGRVPGWLRALATVLAATLLVAGLWVFQIDTWPHWPTSSEGGRAAKGIVVLVFCALWAGLLVQTCLLWSRTRRCLPTR